MLAGPAEPKLPKLKLAVALRVEKRLGHKTSRQDLLCDVAAGGLCMPLVPSFRRRRRGAASAIYSNPSASSACATLGAEHPMASCADRLAICL